MTKKTTDMTVAEFKTASAKFTDDQWREAFLAETTTDGHTARTGVVDHITAYANDKGEAGIIAPPVVETDAEIAARTPGAQPATNASEGASADHARTIAELTDRVAELEKRKDAAKGKGGDDTLREDVLKAFRQIEHVANALNIQLPG